jgi:translation initiation factor IF-2
MKSALVITGMFVASLATAPGVHAEGRRDSRAAAPAQPRAVAVQRSEPRAMPSPSFGGADRGGARTAAREERAQGRSMPRESAPAAPAPRSEPAPAPAPPPPAPPPARVTAPPPAPSGSAAVNDERARGRSAPRDNSGGGRTQAAPRGERRAPDSGREQPASAGSAGRRGERHATRDDGTAPASAPRADRPSDGRYPVGQAARRTRPPYGVGGYYGRPAWYYRPSAFYGYGALGLGYFYYDPFWGGYTGYGYSPYGGYYGGGPYYGGGGYYGGGYYGGGYGGGYDSGTGSGYYGTGNLKLKVKPRDAEVYVDGYYAGLVDDFDGMFQKLELEAGPHRIEVRKAGYSTMTFEVRVPTEESVTYRGELKQLP